MIKWLWFQLLVSSYPFQELVWLILAGIQSKLSRQFINQKKSTITITSSMNKLVFQNTTFTHTHTHDVYIEGKKKGKKTKPYCNTSEWVPVQLPSQNGAGCLSTATVAQRGAQEGGTERLSLSPCSSHVPTADRSPSPCGSRIPKGTKRAGAPKEGGWLQASCSWQLGRDSGSREAPPRNGGPHLTAVSLSGPTLHPPKAVSPSPSAPPKLSCSSCWRDTVVVLLLTRSPGSSRGGHFPQVVALC